MKIKLGVIMDSMISIDIKKDSSIAILLAAQKRNYKIYYININNLFIKNNQACAIIEKLKINLANKNWFTLYKKKNVYLSYLNVILMRKDPPFNMNYIYATYILEMAEKKGVLIINKPKNIRNNNEKIFALQFDDITPDSLVTKKYCEIKKFFDIHKDIIVKPLDSMGGKSIFRIKEKDKNHAVILETITNNEKTFCMIQKYLPSIKKGDKRILIINGKIIPWCLYRIPKTGENRGNLAKGGIAVVKKITNTEFKIANKISPVLKKMGLLITGIDIIGEKLTEINITSPTGICEIENYTCISITKIILDMIEKKLQIL
ncbi:glutathione synthase [Buchnera aphidicola (Mollitrichosiphum nigrofasciatum)]|uniref:glutathione synthase n=1 Tax=Buchnera aphidicola TaxID=9 RepID=UPI0031B82A54